MTSPTSPPLSTFLRSPDGRGAPAVPTPPVCPYLVTADGAWRDSTSSRAHRCTALVAWERPDGATQSSLCLTDEHPRCPRFIAAREMRRARLRGAGIEEPPEPPSASRRVYPRTTPIVLRTRTGPLGRLRGFGYALLAGARGGEGGLGGGGESLRATGARATAGRVGSRVAARSGIGRDQAGLVAFLVVALLLVLVAAGAGGSLRGGPGPRDDAGGLVSPSGPSPTATRASAPPSTTRSPTRAPGGTPSAPATRVPSPGPTVSPTVSPRPRTYVVRAGDTLARIARRFGTTVRVLMDLNGIRDARTIRPGQVLKLP